MPPPSPPSLDSLAEPLRPLAQRGVARRYREGEVLIREGERDDAIYIIVSGSLRAYSRDERDHEITYGIYGPGDYVGEMSLDGGPRSASVAAHEPAWCVMVTRHSLRGHIAAHPDFAFELLARVIQRARFATRIARNVALLDVYARVAILFDELAEAGADGSLRISPRMKHKDIASRVGSSREMVSRLMKDLERGGYVVPTDEGWLLPKRLPPRY